MAEEGKLSDRSRKTHESEKVCQQSRQQELEPVIPKRSSTTNQNSTYKLENIDYENIDPDCSNDKPIFQKTQLEKVKTRSTTADEINPVIPIKQEKKNRH